MKRLLMTAAGVALVAGAALASLPANAFWGPWGGPWWGGPWSGSPWWGGYPGYGWGSPYGWGGYPGWGHPYGWGGYPGWGGWGYPYSGYVYPFATAPAAPKSTESAK